MTGVLGTELSRLKLGPLEKRLQARGIEEVHLKECLQKAEPEGIKTAMINHALRLEAGIALPDNH